MRAAHFKRKIGGVIHIVKKAVVKSTAKPKAIAFSGVADKGGQDKVMVGWGNDPSGCGLWCPNAELVSHKACRSCDALERE